MRFLIRDDSKEFGAETLGLVKLDVGALGPEAAATGPTPRAPGSPDRHAGVPG